MGWDHIRELPSRCTHIYQWMNNILYALRSSGYISDFLMVRMNTQIDDMRGANVWGLPSLPFPYTMLITHMVKVHLLFISCLGGVDLRQAYEQGDLNSHWVTFLRVHFELLFYNYLFQGLLDLHGILYNPNSGSLLGHMPAINFLDFVQRVTEDLNTFNPHVPYKLNLADIRAKHVSG